MSSKRSLLTPSASAAVTYSCAFTAKTCARMSRAYSGHRTITIAINAFFNPGPSAAAIAIARTIEEGKHHVGDAHEDGIDPAPA